MQDKAQEFLQIVYVKTVIGGGACGAASIRSYVMECGVDIPSPNGVCVKHLSLAFMTVEKLYQVIYACLKFTRKTENNKIG